MNMLCIDFDFFFPDLAEDPKLWTLYDWGHAETFFFKGPIWPSRAAGFLMNDLPLPQMNEGWKTFWDRFDIDEDTVLYYADSNVYAVADELWIPGEDPPAQVWLYDAHHDSGYGDRGKKEKPGMRSCEDWMVSYGEAGSELHVRYPTWKTWAMDEPEPWVEVDRAFDDGQPNAIHFDSLFVCRSGAWTPPWCDHDFAEFVKLAPVPELYELDECEPREWDPKIAEESAALQRKMLHRTESRTNG